MENLRPKSVTEVVLKSVKLTKNLTLEKVAILDKGKELSIEGLLPKDYYCIFLRVRGEGNGYVDPSILDIGGLITLSVEDFLEFKKDFNGQA